MTTMIDTSLVIAAIMYSSGKKSLLLSRADVLAAHDEILVREEKGSARMKTMPTTSEVNCETALCAAVIRKLGGEVTIPLHPPPLIELSFTPVGEFIILYLHANAE